MTSCVDTLNLKAIPMVFLSLGNSATTGNTRAAPGGDRGAKEPRTVVTRPAGPARSEVVASTADGTSAASQQCKDRAYNDEDDSDCL